MWQAVHSAFGIDGPLPHSHWREASRLRIRVLSKVLQRCKCNTSWTGSNRSMGHRCLCSLLNDLVNMLMVAPSLCRTQHGSNPVVAIVTLTARVYSHLNTLFHTPSFDSRRHWLATGELILERDPMCVSIPTVARRSLAAPPSLAIREDTSQTSGPLSGKNKGHCEALPDNIRLGY
jgi:hypothetical protein